MQCVQSLNRSICHFCVAVQAFLRDAEGRFKMRTQTAMMTMEPNLTNQLSPALCADGYHRHDFEPGQNTLVSRRDVGGL